MYHIIGTDQKKYGPVSADEVRRWIAESRLHAGSLVQTEGSTDWKPLSQLPEFSAAFPSASAAPLAAPMTAPITGLEQRPNSLATAGLVMSCFALICCGCLPVAILGIVFSWLGLSQANRDPAQSGRSVAIAGLVVGIIALLESFITFAGSNLTRLMETIGRH